MDVGKEREYDLHGQIFAPAISAFTTSLWIMQEVEQCRSNCRGAEASPKAPTLGAGY